jgi:hypothetical protein
MTLLQILYPIILLSAACLGYGLAVTTLFRNRFAGLPLGLRLTTSYFLGQGLLSGLFIFVALCGMFTSPVVTRVVLLGVLICLLSLWLYRQDIWSAFGEASKCWLRAPLAWQFLAILTAGLFLCSLCTMGRTLEGDATAFYFAAAKLIAYTGHIGSLPGYESFSWVISTSEMLFASLILLGAPGTGARLYEWLNFLPILMALYSVARLCDLPARAGLLVASMALTTSAAIGLFGGGKTDTAAIGPALVGIWFALASWRSDHRQTYMAISGLFCGFAIATKTTYLIVLLPGALLLIFWHDACAGFGELRSLAWSTLKQRIRRIFRTSLPFFGLLAIGLVPFVAKNLIIFHSPVAFGSGALASSVYFTGRTTLWLILSYPLALTYGRYWAQLGTLSPLILAYIPLFFLMPREERRLATPLTAITISTVVAVTLWIALMPSIFMPRYILATLLLLGIPAAAGAAYASRGRTILSATVLSAAVIVTGFTPLIMMSRAPIYYPNEAIAYFRDGDEQKLFTRDPYVATINAVNEAAQQSDRVLLLVYPRLWLRGDLLAVTSTSRETTEARDLLNRRSEAFWAYLQEKKFSFLILNAPETDDVAAVIQVRPAGLDLCEIKSYGGVTAYQVGQSCTICPAGDRTTLKGPFTKPWADGNAFRADIPELQGIADSSVLPTQSPLALCEGQTRFWRSHSLHNDIRTEGSGRFSHWIKEVYFSTSDNSDPNTNGRSYTVVKPR